MSKRVVFFIVSVLAFFLLVLTCPDKQAHRDKIEIAMENILDEKFSDTDSGSKSGWAILGSIFVSKMAGVFLDSRLEVSNYLIFSVGRLYLDDGPKTVSFGILNQVFTFEKKDVKQALKEDQEE